MPAPIPMCSLRRTPSTGLNSLSSFRSWRQQRDARMTSSGKLAVEPRRLRHTTCERARGRAVRGGCWGWMAVGGKGLDWEAWVACSSASVRACLHRIAGEFDDVAAVHKDEIDELLEVRVDVPATRAAASTRTPSAGTRKGKGRPNSSAGKSSGRVAGRHALVEELRTLAPVVLVQLFAQCCEA